MTEIEGLDPGICKIVSLLRANGFNTCDSGDGESKEYEHRDEGHVTIKCEPGTLLSESRRIVTVLKNAGVILGPVLPERIEGISHIQAMYCPIDEIALIDVSPIHDRQLK